MMNRSFSTSLITTVFLSCLTLSGSASINSRRHQPPDAEPASRSIENNYLSKFEMKTRQEYEHERGITFAKLVRGNPQRREIALTFDDGPHPQYTRQLLEILHKENVRATFFVVGKMVDRYPETVQMEAADGHEIANHTYNHLRLPTIPVPQMEQELRDGARAIRRALGSPTRLYRPPGGEYDDRVVALTKRLGYVMVLWTDDPGDYGMPGADVIEKRVLKTIRPGGIILLHDGIQQTIDVLPDIIHKLKAQGYRFVTCSEMARERGVITIGGPRVPLMLPPKKTASTSTVSSLSFR